MDVRDIFFALERAGQISQGGQGRAGVRIRWAGQGNGHCRNANSLPSGVVET